MDLLKGISGRRKSSAEASPEPTHQPRSYQRPPSVSAVTTVQARYSGPVGTTGAREDDEARQPLKTSASTKGRDGGTGTGRAGRAAAIEPRATGSSPPPSTRVFRRAPLPREVMPFRGEGSRSPLVRGGEASIVGSPVGAGGGRDASLGRLFGGSDASSSSKR